MDWSRKSHKKKLAQIICRFGIWGKKVENSLEHDWAEKYIKQNFRQQKKIGKNVQLKVKKQVSGCRVESGWTRQPSLWIGLSRVGPSGLQTGAGRVGPQDQRGVSGAGRAGRVHMAALD